MRMAEAKSGNAESKKEGKKRIGSWLNCLAGLAKMNGWMKETEWYGYRW